MKSGARFALNAGSAPVHAQTLKLERKCRNSRKRPAKVRTGDDPIDDGLAQNRETDDAQALERRRARAFRAAAQHSRNVKWLRRGVLIGAGALSVGLIWFSWFRAQDLDGAGFSIAGFGLSGDKITMERPRLTGLRRDGKPFDVTAESGVQNPKNPNRTLLTNLDAKLRMADDSETRILGDHGLYDGDAQTLDLSGHVKIKGANFTLLLNTAAMNFKTNLFRSDEPVRLDLDNGFVEADSMATTPDNDDIMFVGNVRSTFNQPPAQDQDAQVQDAQDQGAPHHDDGAPAPKEPTP